MLLTQHEPIPVSLVVFVEGHGAGEKKSLVF